jgi:hypothetical protein
LCAVLFADVIVDLIVIALRVEGRIDVTEIDAVTGYLATQNVKIVAVIKTVHPTPPEVEAPAPNG